MIKSLRAMLEGADADSKEMLRGSIIAFNVKIIGAGSAFAMNVVISRQLGVIEAGLFFLAVSVVQIAAAISRLGLDNTFVRFFASYSTNNDGDSIRDLYRLGIGWALTVSCAIALLIYFLADLLAYEIFNKPQFAEVIRIMSFGVLPIALFTLHAKALQGTKHILKSMTLLSVATPLAVLALVVLVTPEDATNTAWLYVGSNILALTLGVYWWLRLRPAGTGVIGRVRRDEIRASCVPLLVVVILNQIVIWSSQIMLGIWGATEEVAVFNAAQRTAMLTGLVLVAVNSIVAPKFAAMYGLKQYDAIRRSAVSATRLMLIFGLFPLVMMLAFPHYIISLFGSQFMVGANALRILAVGQFFNLISGSVGFLLSMTGNEKLLRNNVFFAAIVSLGLGFALIPDLGTTGAAIATSIGVAVQNLLGVWQVRRIHGFTTLAIWR